MAARIVNRVPVLKPRPRPRAPHYHASSSNPPVGGTLVIGGRTLPYDAPVGDMLAAAMGL